ncbi:MULTISPECIES: hypothetical protein [Aeromonas]|uniref:hypothetical protein n=1 Tax=Aeromonas TaxID=642 RepID=UPI000A015042|nr:MULTISPECIES: hypothetical protein [Aeromonas]MCX4074027.1 hypothetical protein [Aeromonas caviae]QXC31293.1 hypothetical protein I6L39_06175 [Aeromonas sp. FDAARGOS 1409]QXW29554.1 hypothetical protein KXJ75_23970 [Aeromonas sanarellii]WOX48337.1 hypothetical protein R2B70_19650 [Aeromonas sp. XH]
MKTSTPRFGRSALLSALLAGCTLLVALPAQATEQAQQRRDARDLRQEVRQESREQKRDCRQEEFLGNADCRQEHRHHKQDAREAARDIKY